jgi:hypothetical protein
VSIALCIILDDERQSAAMVLDGLSRTDLNMDSRIGGGNGCNTNSTVARTVGRIPATLAGRSQVLIQNARRFSQLRPTDRVTAHRAD